MTILEKNIWIFECQMSPPPPQKKIKNFSCMIPSVSPKKIHPASNKITDLYHETNSSPPKQRLPKKKKSLFLSRRPRKLLGFKECYFRECHVRILQAPAVHRSNPSTKIRWGIQRHGIQPSRSWLGELQGASECWWAGKNGSFYPSWDG